MSMSMHVYGIKPPDELPPDVKIIRFICSY